MRNAIRAFKGNPIGSIQYGLEIKRCEKCEYKDTGYRDNLLVIAGARAAYMDSQDVINLPEGLDGEDEFSYFVKGIVDYYHNELVDINFDEYIEEALMKKYGTTKGE
jgi:hypothetical protein